MIKEIFSPYRICPIGAHLDHQGGAALGRTITLGTTLTYEPLDAPQVRLTSDQFGEASFALGGLDLNHWARYAQAAARVLPDLQRGIRAHVRGSLIGAGLSSSASVGLAYLTALADVNDIDLSPDEMVELEFKLEHDILGLQIGLLDPLTIVHGRRNALLFMDTRNKSTRPIFDPSPAAHAWIIAYSGVSRELTKSGFNIRVDECHQAASRLKEGAQILSDVTRDLYEDGKKFLPENLRKRAEHFFSEVDRVQQGAQAWRDAKLEAFGQWMNESCRSSIVNYQSGSEILIELHELASHTDGIYGSRFSGGGYGGCVIALAERELAQQACLEIAEKFSAKHRELASKAFVAETGDGIASALKRGQPGVES